MRGGAHRSGRELEHLVLAHERRLQVELHELELAIGPQVLVAQAPGDLEVPVDAPDHAQLLEDLGTLRQGVEPTRVQSRRHHEVASALRRRGDQHGGLDLDESLVDHGGAHGGVDRATRPQVALKAVAPQVDVPVAQPDDLVGVRAVVERERRRLGRVEHLDRAVADLDRPRRQIVVAGALRPLADGARHPGHVFGAQVVVTVDHALDDAGVIPQIDEREVLAVLAAGVDPATHRDLPAGVLRSQLPAVVGP